MTLTFCIRFKLVGEPSKRQFVKSILFLAAECNQNVTFAYCIRVDSEYHELIGKFVTNQRETKL
jgi:hypothetical protein